jgi:hypothetical protein
VTATGVTSSIGQAYLFFGGVDGPEGAPNLALTGTGPYTLYGTSVAGNCDVNGDGWPDLLVGAPQTTAQNNPPYPAGEVLVYLNHGGTLGPSATTTITDGIAGNQFGYSVACAGDVNDDGYADVIVGAIGLNAGGVGNAYIYLGGPDGLEASPIKLTGPSTKSLFGWSVASAGDINGDGYGDVIVGAPGATDIYTANGPTLSVLLGLSASGMNPGWSVAGAAVTGAAESYFFFGELGSGVVGSYMGENTGGTGSAFTLTDPGSSPSSDSFGYSVAGTTTN